MRRIQGLSSVAHGLPLWAAMHLCGFAAISTTACVIPIPSDPVSEDGGLNASPVILSSNPPMPFDLGARLEIDTMPDPTNPRIFTIDVFDANVADKLYVRVFRDYDPTNAFFVEERTAIAND